MVAAAALLAAGLAGCATFQRKLPPPPVVAEVPPASAEPAPPSNLRPPPPIKASCVPKGFPHPPRYPDTDAALLDAGGAADRYQLMAAGRLLRMRRLAELEKVLEGCR